MHQINLYRNQKHRQAYYMFDFKGIPVYWYSMPKGSFYMNLIPDRGQPNYAPVSMSKLIAKANDEQLSKLVEALEEHISAMEFHHEGSKHWWRINRLLDSYRRTIQRIKSNLHP